jgi:Kef-type K+ transport system membrane component KefB
MNTPSSDFLKNLMNSEQLSPAMRASYKAELESITSQPMTPRRAWTGVVLLAVLVVCTIGILRNMFVYDPGPLILLAWGVLATSFSWVSFLIVRDLVRRKHSPKAAFSIGHILMTSAAVVTVVALLIGLNAPDDPASTFNAFFLFVWYFACVTLALDNRIAAAELAAREQMLRIEYRLADLAERLSK